MNLFILIIYQPFLNALVFFYWLLAQIPGNKPDMGIAVIFLSILIRIVLLPVQFASDNSEQERFEIAKKAKEVETQFSSDPVKLNNEMKKLMKTNPRIVFAEALDFAISVMVTILLIRIFATGIEGADLYLLYRWMPHVSEPFNLVFLGKFDLSRPNFILNITQSVIILIYEIVAEFTSPFHNILSKEHVIPQTNAITKVKDNYVEETRNRMHSTQVILPVVSFLVFMFLPAGKKLFIITTLLFSLLFTLVKAAQRKFKQLFPSATPTAVEVLKPVGPPQG